MGNIREKKPEQQATTKPHTRDVFLVVSGPDLTRLEAEAKRRASERLGYTPEKVKLQPVIYNLIREARTGSAQA